MTDLYDVAVVGGGPAGSAAAITARRAGANVLLLERGKFPRQKVCGEFVSSEALGLLRGLLGANSISLFDTAVSITSARIFLDGKIVTTKISPSAKSIPRFNMDSALWHSAGDIGVHAYEQTPIQRIEGSGPFTLHATDKSYAARAVVNASGRWSSLRTNSEIASANPKWIGIKAHFTESQPAQSVDLYFFPGGYCGVQPVNHSEINVCAMVCADVATTLSEVFNCEPHLFERSSGWQLLTDLVSTSPLIFGQPVPLNQNVLLVGDAAGFIDPFVGDGISMALHSGKMAAASIQTFLDRSASLESAAQAYAGDYKQKLLPAFRNASRARKMISAPRILRSAALSVMNFAGVTEFLVSKTRAQIV